MRRGGSGMNRYGFAALITAVALLAVSCAPQGGSSASETSTPAAQATQPVSSTPHTSDASTAAALALAQQNADAHAEKQIAPDLENAEKIELSESVTISEEGTYLISGTLENGQITVDAGDKNVYLVLEGVSVTSASGPALWVKQAKNTYIVLSKDSVNSFTDGGADAEHNAAIYSQDDLFISGDGTLNVNGNNDNGVASKDDLMITGGAINVKAADDALAGRDSVVVMGGALSLSAGGDGIKTTNTEETGKGSIAINGGSITIDAGADGLYAVSTLEITGGEMGVTAGADGLQSGTTLTVADGTIKLTTGGSSANASTTSSGKPNNGWGDWPDNNANTGDTASAKGIKASGAIVIGGGSITIDSSDDAVHSNATIAISGGALDISSGDDGVHADDELIISECTMTIKKAYEGLESSNVTIKGGEVHLTSSDDGINIAGGADSSSLGRPGENRFAQSSGGLNITDGYIDINASGDGLDSNGYIKQTGGTVLISGPTNDGNGALDFSSYDISGGLLIAAGSSQMAQSPQGTSEQPVVSIFFSSTQSAGTLVSIVGTGGLGFEPLKDFASLIVSYERFKMGEAYSVTTGGTVIGTGGDGLFKSAAENGTQLYTFTMSVSSSVGASTPAHGGF